MRMVDWIVISAECSNYAVVSARLHPLPGTDHSMMMMMMMMMNQAERMNNKSIQLELFNSNNATTPNWRPILGHRDGAN